MIQTSAEDGEKEIEDREGGPSSVNNDVPHMPSPLPPTTSSSLPPAACLPKSKLIDTETHFVLTSFNVFLSYLLATAIPDITAVFGLVGATSGCVITFIFPCASFLQLEDESSGVLMKGVTWVVTVLSVALGVIGTVYILDDVL